MPSSTSSSGFPPNEAFPQSEIPTQPGSQTGKRAAERLASMEHKLDVVLEEIHRREKKRASSIRWFQIVIVPLVIALTHLLTRVWVGK